MRINEPNRANLINSYNKTGKTQSPQDVRNKMGKDEVQISNEGLEKLKQLEELDAPLRKEKVNELKEQVQQGTYNVPSDKIAEKFLAFWKKF